MLRTDRDHPNCRQLVTRALMVAPCSGEAAGCHLHPSGASHQQLQSGRIALRTCQLASDWPLVLSRNHGGKVSSAAVEAGRRPCRATFSGGTCISGQTVLAAPQQESVRQCLAPALAAYGAAAVASTAPAEGPAMPQGCQSLPDICRQVDALVAQDGEQCTSQLQCPDPAALTASGAYCVTSCSSQAGMTPTC